MNGQHSGDGVRECASQFGEYFQRGLANFRLPTDKDDVHNGWSGHRFDWRNHVERRELSHHYRILNIAVLERNPYLRPDRIRVRRLPAERHDSQSPRRGPSPMSGTTTCSRPRPVGSKLLMTFPR